MVSAGLSTWPVYSCPEEFRQELTNSSFLHDPQLRIEYAGKPNATSLVNSLESRRCFIANTHPYLETAPSPHSSPNLRTCVHPIKRGCNAPPSSSPHAQLPRSQSSCLSLGSRLHYPVIRMCKTVLPGNPLAGKGGEVGGTKFLAHARDMRSADTEAPAVDLEVPGKQRMRACTRCRRRGEPDDSEI